MNRQSISSLFAIGGCASILAGGMVAAGLFQEGAQPPLNSTSARLPLGLLAAHDPAGAGRALDVPVAAARYVIDGVHSSIIFRVRHNNVANFYGRFDTSSGTFTLADGGAIDVVIKADSVNTGFGPRNEHLKSPDFFSAKEFPDITFRSASVKKTGEATFEAVGDFTLRGVTKRITATIQQTGADASSGAVRAGMETRFIIKRTEFGVSFDLDTVSDEVELIVSLEGRQQ